MLLIALREYAKHHRLDKEGYLFPGEPKATTYSSRSLQIIPQEARIRAGIPKPGSVHAPCNNFATHLLDKSAAMSMIQKIPGYNDIKTTLRYLHISNGDLLRVIVL